MTKLPFKIIGISLIAFTVTFVILYTFIIQPFSLEQDNPFQTPSPFPTMTMQPTQSPSLSPARNLIGTWKTSNPTQFNIKTDFADGTLTDIGSEDRDMTWVVTQANDEGSVYIEVTFASSNRNIFGSGYTPDVSPMFLYGTISGTRLTLQESAATNARIIGQFTFTSDIITGTWDDHWSLAYEQEVYTATNGLILQHEW